MRKRTDDALHDILSICSGGDNAQFITFLTILRELDRQAEEGDEAAEAVIQIFLRFHRLITIKAPMA